MRESLDGVGYSIMVATMLHAIATGNLLAIGTHRIKRSIDMKKNPLDDITLTGGQGDHLELIVRAGEIITNRLPS